MRVATHAVSPPPAATHAVFPPHAPAQGATKHYESAGVHRTEVTRMLHEARDSKGLALYVESKVGREAAATRHLVL